MPFAEGVPTVDITLAGKSYTLGWTWAAKRRVKEYLVAKFVDPEVAPKEEQLAAAVWASMDKDTRSGLSVEEVEEMVHPGNEDQVVETIGSLFEKSEPAPDPNARPAAVKQPTAGESALRKSGQSASTISD